MHRNVAEFTSSTLVISHVIVYYPSMIPMSETILLSLSQTEFIYVLGYRWNFSQFYLIIYKINRTQKAKQLIYWYLITPVTFPQILTLSSYGKVFKYI